MWMVLVSLMGIPDSISGPLLQHLMKLVLTLGTAARALTATKQVVRVIHKLSSRRYSNDQFYSADPLWDGAGCGPLNTCCSFNNPPWFYKELPQPTTDDIEMRVCRNQPANDEDIAIDIIEVYVQ